MIIFKLLRILQESQVINEGREFNPFSFIIGDGFSALVLLMISIFFIVIVVTLFFPTKHIRRR